MDWKAFWGKFRTTVYFRLVYLTLVALIGMLLLMSFSTCFALLLIPVLILLVPHAFGERRLRSHAVNVIFVIALSTALYAPLATSDVVTRPQAPQAFDGVRADFAAGLVTPFRCGDVPCPANTAFNFTVNVTSTDAGFTDQSVELVVLDLVGIDVRGQTLTMIPLEDRNLSNGETFYLNTTLPPAFHIFNFNIVNASGAPVEGTFGSAGPFNAGYDVHLATIWLRAFFFSVFILFGFYLMLMLYWWTRRARQVRGTMAPPEAKRAEGGGEFTCTNCGADVAETAAKCPKCGAVFEPEAERESAEPVHPK